MERDLSGSGGRCPPEDGYSRKAVSAQASEERSPQRVQANAAKPDSAPPLRPLHRASGPNFRTGGSGGRCPPENGYSRKAGFAQASEERSPQRVQANTAKPDSAPPLRPLHRASGPNFRTGGSGGRCPPENGYSRKAVFAQASEERSPQRVQANTAKPRLQSSRGFGVGMEGLEPS